MSRLLSSVEPSRLAPRPAPTFLRYAARLACLVKFGIMAALLGASVYIGRTKAAEPPARIALVIGNGTYSSLPAVPACQVSARVMTAALRAQGYEVLERIDAGRGEFEASIGALARRLTNAPGAAAVVYYCGHITEFNGRTFLLPISASVPRDFDVLSQGVLAKSLQDSVRRAGQRSGFVVLDAFSWPGGAGGTSLTDLAEQAQAAGVAFLAAVEKQPNESPTALATVLREELGVSAADPQALVAAVRRRLSDHAEVAIAAAVAPGGPNNAPNGTSASPPPPPTAPSAAGGAPAATIPTGDSAAGAGARLSAPPLVVPDEDRMSEADRRQIQTSLAKLGYYGGRIDGIFGPETRAAIRRYQFELRAEQTARLTEQQATRLVNSVR